MQAVVHWPSYGSKIVHWVHITWVCRQWREVAIADCGLWTKIYGRDSTHGRWLPTFLDRASDALLDVDIGPARTWQDEAFEFKDMLNVLAPHASTIRTFSLVADDNKPQENMWMTITPLLTQMRNLEDLSLHFYSSAQFPFSTDGLTRGELPRLHSLHFNNVHFPWSSPLYNSLRELILNNIPSSRAPAAEDILRILHSSPDLERFEMDNSSYQYPAFTASLTVDQLSPVSLPRLYNMRIRDSFQRANFLCKCLTIPVSCNIDIIHNDRGDTIDPIAVIFPSQAIFRPLLPLCTHIKISTDEFDFSLSASIGPVQYGLPGPPLGRVRVGGLGDQSGEEPAFPPASWNTLLDLFSPQNSNGAQSAVVHLGLVYNRLPEISEDMWRLCATRFPLLEGLEVGPWLSRDIEMVGARVFGTMLAFLSGCGDPNGAQSRAVYAPRLRSIQFAGMIFDNATVDVLVRMVEARMVGGAPLEELIFRNAVCLEGIDPALVKLRLEEFTRVTIK